MQYGGNRTKPKHEYLHVAMPDQAPVLCRELRDGQPFGVREPKSWQHFQDNKGMLIMKSFQHIKGWGDIDIVGRIKDINTADDQIISVRM